MVTRCCVSGCRNEAERGSKRFHRFPRDPEACRLWLAVIRHRLATESVSRERVRNLRVCSDHFSPEDYRERSLHPSAVPSIFSWTQVFSKKERKTPPLSACSKVADKSWRKAGKILQTHHGSSVFKSNEVLVNTQCLLELFQYCWLCQIDCCITIEGHERQFSITQDCQSCGHHREWRSHHTPADETVEDFSEQQKDLEKAFHEEHEDEGAVLNPETENTPGPVDEESEEVVIQIVSSDNEGTEQNCETFIRKDGLFVPKPKEETSEHEDMVKKNHRKRKAQRQDGLFEVAADSGLLKDEGFFVEGEVARRNMGKNGPMRRDGVDKVASGSGLTMDESLFIVDEVDGRDVEKRDPKRLDSLDEVAADSDLSQVEGLLIVEKKTTRKRKPKILDSLDEVTLNSDVSIDEDLWNADDDDKKKTKKRKSKRQDSSDEWQPHLDEVAADINGSMDLDLFSALTEDDQGKAVVCCIVCRTDARLSCSLHHHKKVFVCVQCKDSDNSDMGQRHSTEKPVHFKDLPSFQKHAEEEHGAKPFQKLCQECGKLIIADPKSRGGKDHVCEHKTKPVVCPECEKRFLTEVGLKRHFSKLHKDADHPCKYCLKLFKNRPSKLEHEQTHPKEKQPYSCPDCPERFDNLYKRNSHLKLHRGPYKYACDTCGKRFRDIIMLKRHKLIHSGEKPFRCQVCERSFNQMSNLSSHMRLHTGEKPYMCEQCGECFNHNVSLKNHLARYHQAGLSQTEWQGDPEDRVLH